MWQLVKVGTKEVVHTYSEGPAAAFRDLLEDYVDRGPYTNSLQRFDIIPASGGKFMVVTPAGSYMVERVNFND